MLHLLKVFPASKDGFFERDATAATLSAMLRVGVLQCRVHVR